MLQYVIHFPAIVRLHEQLGPAWRITGHFLDRQQEGPLLRAQRPLDTVRARCPRAGHRMDFLALAAEDRPQAATMAVSKARTECFEQCRCHVSGLRQCEDTPARRLALRQANDQRYVNDFFMKPGSEIADNAMLAER